MPISPSRQNVSHVLAERSVRSFQDKEGSSKANIPKFDSQSVGNNAMSFDFLNSLVDQSVSRSCHLKYEVPNRFSSLKSIVIQSF